MAIKSWDQRLAHILVKPLVATPVLPNHLTGLSFLFGLAAIVYVIWEGASAERAAAETTGAADGAGSEDAGPEDGAPVGPRAADREARFGSRRRVGAPSDALPDRR